jgi:hypothetical protein
MSDDFANETATDQLVIGGPQAPKSRKRWWIGGGALGVLAIGGGVAAWAVASFFSQGDQPAEALPDSTIGYVSIDLDPSGGQKIAALKLARKFPAFKDEVGLETDDDIRRWIFDKAAEGNCDLDFDKDVAPWLGSRAAVAAVGTDKPSPVVVVQTSDPDKAEKGVKTLISCGGKETADPEVGWVVDGDWIVFAETTEQAKEVVQATHKGSLADDPDFQDWTGKAGDSGILTAYAAPTAGQVIVKGLGSVAGETAGASPFDPSGMLTGCPGLADPTESQERMKAKLADFRGAAATLRFGDDGLELEAVGDMTPLAGKALGKPSGTPVVSTLPADTAVAFGLAYPKGWADMVTDGLKEMCGDESDPSAMLAPFSQLTGLDLPGDLEKLLGDSAALALGPDLDVESLVNGGDPSGLPLALKVRGEKQMVDQVATKLRESLHAPEGVFEPVAGDDSVAIGLDQDYAGAVAKAGKLGTSEAFTSVVPEADKANGVMFVNFNALGDAIKALASGDDQITANLKPLQAFGLSSWADGDDTHGRLKISVE